MIKNIRPGISVIIFLSIVALVYLVASYEDSVPKFSVKNAASVPVHITAHWREERKSFGVLSPGGELEFEVNAEAEMKFEAEFPNGTVISNSPAVYFTAGSIVNVVVTESSIEITTQ
ncbi:MAG TPA: hypothetical protein VL995_01905 [Cellvibrio sp.]|nr:hypothetical protein [Cellvibrio sp.]